MCPRKRRRGNGPAALLASACLLVAGCRQQMDQQPYQRPLTASDVFPDGASARPLPPDTVARGGQGQGGTALSTGKVNGVDVPDIPVTVTHELMARGQSRFTIYCSVCHGDAGYGDGLVVQRGFTPPPSFHTDALRQAPAGHIFDVITNGFGAMPSYAAQVAVPDRWAIVAYVRALQRSQHASLDDVPADQRARLEQQP